MSNKLSLSVILPIKSSKTKDFEDYFEKAITSLKNQKIEFEELVIVHTNEESLVTILNNYDFGNLTVTKLPWDKTPNYAEQVNYGIKNAKGTWISLFEFDDEYSSIWFKNVLKYSEVYPDVHAFLPIVVDVDNTEKFAGFTNEATFAANFTPEMGILTNETLIEYNRAYYFYLYQSPESFFQEYYKIYLLIYRHLKALLCLKHEKLDLEIFLCRNYFLQDLSMIMHYSKPIAN